MIRLNILQQIANDLSDFYDPVVCFARIPVYEDHTRIHNPSSNGEYCPYSGQFALIIDERITDDKAIIAVYPEWRHYWQHIMYPDIFNWWMAHDNADFYSAHYNSVFCTIEEDAHVFGFSYGDLDREDLLKSLTKSHSQDMKENPDKIRT